MFLCRFLAYIRLIHRSQDINGVCSPEDLLPADRVFDAIALRLSAYALHETSYRLPPTGAKWTIAYLRLYSQNFSTDRPIGPKPRRHRRLEILGGVVPQTLSFVCAITRGL